MSARTANDDWNDRGDNGQHSGYEPICSWRTVTDHLRHAEANVLVFVDVPSAVAGEIECLFGGRNVRKIHENTSANQNERNNAQTDISTDSFAPDHESGNAATNTNFGASLYQVLVGTHDATSTPDSLPFTSALVASLSELCEASSTDNAETMPFTTRQLLARIKRHLRSKHAPTHYLARDPPFRRDIYLEPLRTPGNSRDRLSRLRGQEDVAAESASEIDDDDAASVFSEISIASSVSSIEGMGDENMTEELVRAFTYNVFHTLELASLSTAALAEPKIGSARFARNFRRLIAQFGSNAKKQGATSTQLQAARLLRSRRISARAAQLVVELIEADNLTALHDGNSEEPEAGRSLRVYSNLISDAYRKDASGDANASDEGDDGEVDSEADGSEQAEDEDDDSILSRGTIDQVKLFLLGSEAYALFRAQLLDFVHSPYEKRLYLALRDSTIISDSGTPVSPDAKIGLVRELSWVPPTLFDFAFEVQAPRFNHLKAFVEDSLGEVWDWWPLRQRVRSLKAGYCRLSWATVSYSFEP